MRSFAIALLIWMLPPAVSGMPADRTVSIADAAQQAVQRSQLTLPGGKPFHLKAKITESTNPKSDYRADIEEFWVSPAKWRRSIQAPGFSQVLTVRDDKVSEQDTGDYYPFWLHELVTALFDPLPMLEQIKRVPGQVEIPDDSTESSSCMNLQRRTGVPPVQSSVPMAFCFQGKGGLLKLVSTPGYAAEFQDYKLFRDKLVPRRIVIQPQPGLTIAAEITLLEDFDGAEEHLGSIDPAAAPALQLKSVEIGEDAARRIAVNAPEIAWPGVRSGKTSGFLTLYISADRSGRVREAWPVRSDNPGVSQAAREQVLRWQFQPYVNGIPMQMESLLTFAFATKIENPIPMLNNAQVRKLATRVVEARVAPGAAPSGKKFTLRISVDEQGKLLEVQNPNKVAPRLFTAGDRALRQWRFRPFMNNGKPDRFDADVTFLVR